MRREAGFTLIEMMISMTILSMVMLLGTWSFSLFIDRWDGRLGYFSKHASQAKDLILLNEIVSGISPFVYRKNGQPSYYFELVDNQITGVTQNPIFHNNEFALFKLSVERSASGLFYLLYKEAKIQNLYQANTDIYDYEKVLINDTARIDLNVLAWDNFQQKITAEDPLISDSNLVPQWRSGYDSSLSNLMPIKVSIATQEGNVTIPVINDQGRWLNLILNFGDENA
ncbi:pilus assembly FimT family protein [Thalassotalea montiporae]